MKKNFIHTIVLCLLLCVTFTSCKSKSEIVASIDVDLSSVPDEVIVTDVDVTQIVLQLHKKDESIEKMNLTLDMIQNKEDLSKVGNQTIQVKYLDFTTSFVLNIKEVPVILTKIEIDSKTVAGSYYIDEFDCTTISLNLYYSNNTYKSVALSSDWIQNKDVLELSGKQNIQVKYETKTTSFSVELKEKEKSTEGLVFKLNDYQTGYTVTNYRGIDKVVYIPSMYEGKKVTLVDLEAFAGNTDITEVYFGENVTKIADQAFEKCTSLTAVHFSKSLTKIGEKVFNGCSRLTVEVPSTITTIGASSFSMCRCVAFEMTQTTLQNSSHIEKNIVDTENTAVYYGVDFAKTKEINGIVYLSQENGYVAALGNVKGEVNLETTIENMPVVSLGDFCFSNQEVTSVVLSNTIKTIGRYAFRNCESLENVVLSNTLEEIQDYAFAQCIVLKDMAFPQTLKTIGNAVFSACHSLTTFIFSEGLESIGNYCFQNSYIVDKVFIPQTVVSIGIHLFYACSKAKIYCEAASRPQTWEEDWIGSSAKAYFGATLADVQ